MPAKNGVHFGVALTLTPQAPGGGVAGPLLAVKVPMGWPAELRNWAFHDVPMPEPLSSTSFWTIMAICWVVGELVPLQ